MDNICHLLNNFLRCSAYENIIFCWVMDRQEIIRSIMDKLDIKACQVKLISLTADEASLRERLEGDVAKGIRTGDVIERSMARLVLYQELDTSKIDTTGKTVQMIVEEMKSIGEKQNDDIGRI